SFSDIGHRSSMEDEHIRIGLSAPLGSLLRCSAFYGVTASTKRHAIRFLFEDAKVPRASSEAKKDFVESVENSVRQAFLLADLAMAEDCTVCSSSGTTAITGLVLGRQRTLPCLHLSAGFPW
ncbi:hypothetical protein B296_00019003, partial [Ensete ventricosum]